MKYKVCDSKNDNLPIAEFISLEEAVTYCNRRNSEENALLFVKESEYLPNKSEHPREKSSDASYEGCSSRFGIGGVGSGVSREECCKTTGSILTSPYFAFLVNLILFPIMLRILPWLFENKVNVYLDSRSEFSMLVMNLGILFSVLLIFLEMVNKGIRFFSSKRRLDIRLLVTFGSKNLALYLVFFMTLSLLKFITTTQTGGASRINDFIYFSGVLSNLLICCFLCIIGFMRQNPICDLIMKLTRRSWRLKSGQ